MNATTRTKEAVLLAIAQSIRCVLSSMTDDQLEKLMKSPLEDFKKGVVKPI